MAAEFLVQKSGLTVTVTNMSSLIPVGSTYLWDFGDGNTDTNQNPSPHTYLNEGIKTISLTIDLPDPEVDQTSVQTIILSSQTNTQLSGSIYTLIDAYIPDDLLPYITFSDKRVYIEKWQYYMQPVVNHDVPLEQSTNELYYEALENQLIMELAAYDWLTVGITNLLRSLSSTVVNSTNGSQTTTTVNDSQGIKKIVTGPSEVEFFDGILNGDSASQLAKTITGAMQPGGMIDNIRKNICMLAQRLDIYLPICDQVSQLIVPEVSNRRDPGLLGGPNPTYPVKK